MDRRFILIALLALCMATGASAKIVCSDTPISGGIVVLKLSALTNAHAELYNQTNYTTQIWCNEDSGVALNNGSANPVTLMNLSAPTNAHAEVVSATPVYTTPVLVGHNGTGVLDAQFATFPSTCASLGPEYATVAHLSSLTNAHAEGPNGTNYNVQICLGYFPGGSPAEPIVDIVSNQTTGGFLPSIYENQTMGVQFRIQKTAVDPGIANTRDVVIGSICDLTKTECQNASDYTSFYLGMLNDGTSPLWNGTVFTHRMANAYGIYSTYAPTLIPVNLTTVTLVTPTNLEAIGGNDDYTYTIDPTAMGLAPGNYRLNMLALNGQYDYTVTPTNNKAETPGFVQLNNFFSADFEIKAGSTSGGGAGGNGGDVFILKSIDYDPNPPIEGADFGAKIVVQNQNTGLTTSGKMDIIIRDGDGNPVLGVTSPTCLQCFAAGQDLDFSSASEITIDVPIELAAIPNANLVPGQTYTLYANVLPYVDGTPTPTNDSETVVGNNAAFKTFAILNPQETVNVPDAPWWMSLVMVSVVLGWLFVSSRKENN